MSPKLPRLSGQEVVKALESLGFEFVRQNGSHRILKKQTPNGEVGCVVPMHRELADRTLRGVLKQAGITEEEFKKNL